MSTRLRLQRLSLQVQEREEFLKVVVVALASLKVLLLLLQVQAQFELRTGLSCMLQWKHHATADLLFLLELRSLIKNSWLKKWKRSHRFPPVTFEQKLRPCQQAVLGGRMDLRRLRIYLQRVPGLRVGLKGDW